MKIDSEALIKFLKEIYNESRIILLSNKQIKDIEDFYNKNYANYSNISDFYSADSTIAKNIKKVKSVRCEIERQFLLKKRLQSGTVCECVMAETIAKMYNLDCFADIFHTYVRDLPANILYRLRDDNNKVLCRYIYYNSADLNNFLIQYGNPTRYDADLYLDDEIVKIEFKDKIARAGEKETEYDNDGKLIYTDKFAEENPDYIPLIDSFNEDYNLIDIEGNYQIESDEDRKSILKSYFKNLGFETLVSIDDNNQLIAITEDCIDIEDSEKIISLEGSEIRRAGKNSYNVFTPELLLKSIKRDNGKVSGEIVSIPSNNMLNRTNNGKITGKKINHLFYVSIENITDEYGNCIFLIKNVKQLKPTLCVHMQIVSDRNRLVNYYLNLLNNK